MYYFIFQPENILNLYLKLNEPQPIYMLIHVMVIEKKAASADQLKL